MNNFSISTKTRRFIITHWHLNGYWISKEPPASISHPPTQYITRMPQLVGRENLRLWPTAHPKLFLTNEHLILSSMPCEWRPHFLIIGYLPTGNPYMHYKLTPFTASFTRRMSPISMIWYTSFFFFFSTPS